MSEEVLDNLCVNGLDSIQIQNNPIQFDFAPVSIVNTESQPRQIIHQDLPKVCGRCIHYKPYEKQPETGICTKCKDEYFGYTNIYNKADKCENFDDMYHPELELD